MKKALIAILILGLIGTGSYGVYHHFFKDTQIEAGRVSSDSDDAVYVDAVSAITGYGSGNGLIQRFAGEIEPQATLEIKLEGDKTVDECFVKEGDIVKKGQRLFTYDIRETEDNLMQAEIDLERLASDIEVSERQIGQLEKEKKNAEDEDEKLSIETDIMSLQASIKRSEYEIKSKKVEMERMKESIDSATVTAEMGGKVQKISDTDNADSYSYSYSDSAVYITILAEGDFRVKGSVNEQAVNLGMVYSGMPVIVYSRVDDSMMWKGTVTEVDTSNSEDNGSDNMYYYYGSGSGESSSYTFYVELEHSDGLILGQHVYLEEDMGQDQQKDGLWLEEYYLTEEDGTYFVWMANDKNVIVKQTVTLGEYDDELSKYEILSGLTADDYIAYPQESVFEGCPVIYNDFNSGADVMFGDEYNEDEYYDEEYFDDAEYYDDEEYFEDEEYYDDEVYFEDEEYSDDEVYFEDEEYSDDEVYFEDEEYSDDAEYSDDEEYSAEEADMGAALFSLDGDIEFAAPEEYVEEGTYINEDGSLAEDVSEE